VKNQLKIVFLGSGDIAVPILKVLANAPEIDLAAVVSQPDRPAGRKRILTPTPLAAAALDLGLEPVRVADVNTPEFLDFLQQKSPDMLCVVSFGQILKAGVLNAPKYCCVNVHASLLPAYRGASPITQAIRNGDRETGVCFMEMERGLDSGAVFKTLTMPLNGSEYADTLELQLGELAAAYAVETLLDIASGKLHGVPQDPAKISICRKISKRDGAIDWNFDAATIEAMSRAYFPWPGAVAKCRVSGKETAVTVCRCAVAAGFELAPGTCAEVSGKLIVGCGKNSALEIFELTPSGGKRMTSAAFRNGMRGGLPEFIIDNLH